MSGEFNLFICTMTKSSFEQANQLWWRSWCFSNLNVVPCYIYIMYICKFLTMYVYLVNFSLDYCVLYKSNFLSFPLPTNVLLIHVHVHVSDLAVKCNTWKAHIFLKDSYHVWECRVLMLLGISRGGESCMVCLLRAWSLWYLVIMF